MFTALCHPVSPCVTLCSPLCHFVRQLWQFPRVFAQNYFFPSALHCLMYSDSGRTIQCFLLDCANDVRFFSGVLLDSSQSLYRFLG